MYLTKEDQIIIFRGAVVHVSPLSLFYLIADYGDVLQSRKDETYINKNISFSISIYPHLTLLIL